MTDMRENGPNPKQPALILLFGTGDGVQRQRPLNRDAVILGRSRGCDLVLEAPDVSSPHCVIYRSSFGYSVRDCGSRAGIRLNGDAIQEARLLDGDLLQVGPFSFRLLLPASKQEALQAARESRLALLERKRLNLTRLALAQRRLIRELSQPGRNTAAVDADLTAKADALQERIRNYEQRFFRLDQAERDLTRDRQVFQEEQQTFEAQIMEAERELDRRRAELQAEIERSVGGSRLSSSSVS